MTGRNVRSVTIQDHSLWGRLGERRVPLSFNLEITARCNNSCRHCYINLPAEDRSAQARELSPDQISRLADEAVSLGAMWCLITGGEPFLRDDFPEIYENLKRKGLLVSIFTNACLINESHIRLFKRCPPRDIEVSVYGVTGETYERITRRAGSFAAFRRGLDLLEGSGTKVRLKAVAMRSNVAELPAIERFCLERTKDYFRFDPFLHLRYDGNERRNAEIRAERLQPEEIVRIEQADAARVEALRKECGGPIVTEPIQGESVPLFRCGTGNSGFSVSFDGLFRLCPDLWHPDCVYDLKKGALADAWNHFAPKVREKRTGRNEYLTTCQICPVIDLCFWCPAHAHLETGALDARIEYFCRVAHARARALKFDDRLKPAGKNPHL